ncbi:MAG: tetratricopeptide repeat protein, partial [Gemmatimonadota bacterium]|nr:tetratricopeptide repeat protein [Gemmatimonadota bacterium]
EVVRGAEPEDRFASRPPPGGPQSGPPVADPDPAEVSSRHPSPVDQGGVNRSAPHPRAAEGRPVTAERREAQGSIDSLLEAGEYRRAVPLLETSLEERPDDIALLLLSGKVFSAVGDYERAQGLFDRAMELAPDDLSVRKEAGIALYRRGLYSEAADTLAIVCARSERDGEAYFYRGEALNRSGQSEEAARAMEKASALMPDDERPLMSLGRIFDRLGMVEEAGQMYGRVRALARKRAAAEEA